MTKQDDIVKNLEKCKHFNTCSQNLCPLDLELHLRAGKVQDKCRYMREPKQKKIGLREFVSGGSVMPDASLIFVPESNLDTLNKASQDQWKQL